MKLNIGITANNTVAVANYLQQLVADKFVLYTKNTHWILYIREIITPISDDFKDLGTADFVTGLVVTHEKMAWFLRAHLK